MVNVLLELAFDDNVVGGKYHDDRASLAMAIEAMADGGIELGQGFVGDGNVDALAVAAPAHCGSGRHCCDAGVYLGTLRFRKECSGFNVRFGIRAWAWAYECDVVGIYYAVQIDEGDAADLC
jgi:hypothetical protein